MKIQNNQFEFKKESIVELNNAKLNTVVGGTGCFLCIRTSNGSAGTILDQLNQA